MRAIIVPFAACLDKLAGGDHRGMTDDGNRITFAARLYAQHAEAVVFVMECYPLDEASEDFRRSVSRSGLKARNGANSLFKGRGMPLRAEGHNPPD